MSKYSLPTKIIREYGVEVVDKWEAPQQNDARIIGMPNIPKPLHLINPRNLLGPKTWNTMRRQCYADANDTCEICGHQPEDKSRRHAHEIYSIDYKTGVATFERCICVCYLCHVLGIHSGRAITLYKNKSPVLSKESILAGAENAFRIASEWNSEHEEKIKLYGTFLEYLNVPSLRQEMVDLVAKYKPKFYITTEGTKESADWGEWKLKIGTRDYDSPYKNADEWQQAMDKASKRDTDRNVKSPLTGGAFDALDKILGNDIK